MARGIIGKERREKNTKQGAKAQEREDISFHCLFCPVSFADGAKEAEEHGSYWRSTQAAHAFSVLALGWYVSRFQRFCRFAASETGAFDSARSSMAQFSMGDRLRGAYGRETGQYDRRGWRGRFNEPSRRRGLKARTTAGRWAREWTLLLASGAGAG